MNYQKKSPTDFKVRTYQAQPLALGKDIVLSVSSSHHLITVMRHKMGDRIAVFNGTDGEWLAEIISADRKNVTCSIQYHLRQPVPNNGADLMFSPIRPNRQAFLIEKATELGVTKLMPIISQRSQIRTFNHEKAMNQAIEAAEQCERITIPIFEPIIPLTQKLAVWDPKRLLLVGTARGQAALLSELRIDPQDYPLSFLIGPEGGFTDQELDLFKQYCFIRSMSLGENILRAETAALACLAQVIC